MNRFEDKVVIVTGAGSGIGAATALRFSNEGASVVLVGRTRQKLERTAAGMPEGKTLVYAGDVSKLDDVEKMVREVVQTFGKIDVLANCAGVAAEGKITEASVEDWKKVMAIDLDGVFYCCRSVMPELIKTQGSIVNVSSVSGLGGDWAMSFYNAAKGAVTNFTRSLALDHGPDGVRVNAVCPTLTRTDMTKDMFANTALIEKFKERIALQRAAEPKDIAGVIAFLASDDARFVTGVNLPVDGGLSASNGQPQQA